MPRIVRIPILSIDELKKRFLPRRSRWTGDRRKHPVEFAIDVQETMRTAVEKEESNLACDLGAEEKYASCISRVGEQVPRLYELSRRLESKEITSDQAATDIQSETAELGRTLRTLMQAFRQDQSDDEKQVSQILEHEDLAQEAKKECQSLEKRAVRGAA